MGWRWISPSLWPSMPPHPLPLPCSPLWRKGTTYFITVFTTGCRGICATAPEAPPSPPFSLTLVSVELFVSCVLPPLSHCCCCAAVFYPFLNILSTYHRGVANVSDRLSFGQQWVPLMVPLEPAGNGFERHGDIFHHFLTKASPAAPNSAKTCRLNPIQFTCHCRERNCRTAFAGQHQHTWQRTPRTNSTFLECRYSYWEIRGTCGIFMLQERRAET